MDEEPDANAIPLVEEAARVAKERVSTGRVRVRTVTDTFEETVEAALLREAVTVTRVPVDREVTVVPSIRTEGDVTIVPVLEEVLVVEKRLVLKEEVHVRRATAADHFESSVTLRRQRAVVERQDAGDPPAPAASTPKDLP